MYLEKKDDVDDDDDIYKSSVKCHYFLGEVFIWLSGFLRKEAFLLVYINNLLY